MKKIYVSPVGVNSNEAIIDLGRAAVADLGQRGRRGVE